DISKLDNIWFGHDGAPTAMNIDTLFGAYSHWICKGYAQPVRTGQIRTFRPVIGNYLDIERVARPRRAQRWCQERSTQWVKRYPMRHFRAQPRPISGQDVTKISRCK